MSYDLKDASSVSVEKWERAVAVACQVSPLVGLPLVLPLGAIFLLPAFGRPSPFVRQHAMQAVIFHLLVLVVTGTLLAMVHFFFALILIGWPMAILLGIV